MFVEVSLRPLEAARGHAESRAAKENEVTTEPAPEPVGRHVPCDDSHPDEWHENTEANHALPRHNAAESDRYLPGQHEAEECARLEKAQHGYEEIRPLP